jgi:hypothetical protein
LVAAVPRSGYNPVLAAGSDRLRTAGSGETRLANPRKEKGT